MTRFVLLVVALLVIAGCGLSDDQDEQRAKYDTQIRREVDDRIETGIHDFETLADELDEDSSVGASDEWRDRAFTAANEFVRARVWFAGADPPDDWQDHNAALDMVTNCYANQATDVIATLTTNQPSQPSAEVLRGIDEKCGPLPVIKSDSP